MLTTMMNRMENRPTLVVSCTDSSTARDATAPLREGFYPGLDILVRTPESARLLDRLAPHTRHMEISDTTRFYLCANESCQAPVTDINVVVAALNQPTGDL